MIPPANMIQDESGGKEDERDQDETPKSPTANASHQETKVGLSCYYVLFTIPRIDGCTVGSALCISLTLINRAGQTNFYQHDNKIDSTGTSSQKEQHACKLCHFLNH